MKVPLVVRSILIGFSVTTSGVGIWVLLAENIPVPWSVLTMGAILIFYWMYFSGRGGRDMRGNRLSGLYAGSNGKKYGPVAGTSKRKPVSVTGVDRHFVITLVVVVLSALFFILAIRKLLKQKEAVS
jgi:hypothetical protein